jgi:hypothetical protein
MRNQVEFSTDANDHLTRLRSVATDPDEVDRVADQLELCLTWYDPRTDSDNTMNCGPVSGPGLLPAPHFTARMISVTPLRYYFEVDDTARPFIMTVVRIEWVLSLVDPNAP